MARKRSRWTREEVMAQARMLYPGAAPAFLEKLVAILLKFLPLLALFMARKPDDDPQQLAMMASLVDATPDTDGEGKPMVAGPIMDPYYEAASKYLSKLAKTHAPAAIDFAIAFAKRWASKLTP